MASAKSKFFSFWLFGKNDAGLSGGKKAAFHLWNWLLPLLAALGTGLGSLLLAFGRYAWEPRVEWRRIWLRMRSSQWKRGPPSGP